MKGNPAVVEALNDILTAELTAINQYYVHFKMCANWGYGKLAAHLREESIEEMKHADQLIDRILYLDGVPNMQRLYPVRVGENVPEQHQLDLELEKQAVERLNKAIALCVQSGDNGTRAMLEELLRQEEEAIDWTETQLGLIAELGKERYLAEMIG